MFSRYTIISDDKSNMKFLPLEDDEMDHSEDATTHYSLYLPPVQRYSLYAFTIRLRMCNHSSSSLPVTSSSPIGESTENESAALQETDPQLFRTSNPRTTRGQQPKSALTLCNGTQQAPSTSIWMSGLQQGVMIGNES
ncbi:uncharacterized protein LOC119962358 isoform X2 [Scyliorhinus canicula]|uniref:uncharacterized protein LOC119962358 isoform X2 n=1 Tax=Scyliorhinus canicula TaxID=7830 RepID=UPI0018F507B1|nr:uncharacterized protein LOC119962358 isoform X2 [Scyliorhinus canicula]